MHLRWYDLVRRYFLGEPVSTAVLTMASALLIVTAVKAAELAAPTAQPSYALVDGMNEFGIWAGGSPEPAFEMW